MELNFFDKIFINWNCVENENFYDNRFQNLRVNILSKLIL